MSKTSIQLDDGAGDLTNARFLADGRNFEAPSRAFNIQLTVRSIASIIGVPNIEHHDWQIASHVTAAILNFLRTGDRHLEFEIPLSWGSGQTSLRLLGELGLVDGIKLTDYGSKWTTKNGVHYAGKFAAEITDKALIFTASE